MDNLSQLLEWLKNQFSFIFPLFEQIWDLFSDYTYLRVAFIVIIAYVLAKLLSRHIPKYLLKLLDKFGHFPFAKDLVGFVRTLIYQLIFYVGLLIAVHASTLNESVNFAASAIVKSLIVLAIGLFLYKVLKTILRQIAYSKQEEANEDAKIIQPATLPLFENAVLMFFSVAILYQIFSVWNVDITALLASAGIFAMAIGMAMRETLADVISGILLLTDPPFRVGDIIQIKNNLTGTVKHIGIRNTRIFTIDNVEIIVPNSLIDRSEVINQSSADDITMRVRFDVNVAYGTEPEYIRELLLRAAKDSIYILQDKTMEVRLSTFKRNMATFSLYCWVGKPQHQGLVLPELNELIYKIFIKEDISISLPEREEVSIIEHVGIKQEVAITELPTAKQEIYVKEFPNTKQEIDIKEIPNLFGNAPAKKLTKIKKVGSNNE